MMRRGLLLALLASGCHYDLDAVDRPGVDGGSGSDGAVADPCGVDAVPAAVHLHGVVLDAAEATPIGDVTVDAAPGGNAVSAGDGSFAIDVELGGVPRAISLALDSPGEGVYPLHRREFQRPFDRAEVDVQPRLHSFSQLDTTTLYGYGDNPLRDPAAVTVVLWVFDCEDGGVSDAIAAVEPAPDSVEYYGGGSSTDPTGVAYALNVPAGSVTAGATGSEPFTFEAAAGTVVIVQLVVP